MKHLGWRFLTFFEFDLTFSALVVLSCLAPIAKISASPLDYWTWSNPGISGTTLYSVAYGNGTYVAVGDLGTILTSRDGVHWKNKSLPISDAFGSIAFGNGIFVAYLFEGTSAPSGTAYTYFLASTNGENWNVVFSDSHPSLYGRTENIGKIIFANGTFVAVGGNNSFVSEEKTTWLLTSPNGTNWTTQIFEPGYPLYSVTYAQNEFVAIGEEGLQMTSSNGLTWSGSVPADYGGTAEWVDITYYNGRFFAVANTSYLNNMSRVFTSSNGVDWDWTGTNVTSYALMRKISSYNGELLTTGESGQTFVSEDGTNWSSLLLPASVDTYDAEFIQGTTFLIAAEGYIFSATNGQPWSIFPSRFSELGERSPQDFASHGNVLVTVSQGGFVASSRDGQSWAQGTNSSSEGLYNVTHGDGKFVATGDDQTIVVSTNGQFWQTAFSNPSSAKNMMGVAWNGSLFTAVGFYGYTFTSTNGWDWDMHQATSSFFWSITAGNGLFVANTGPVILNSTDGVNWIQCTNTGGPIMRYGVYANGRFVLVGDTGVVMVSTNGTDWSSNAVPFDGLLRKVIAVDNVYIAAGDGGVIFSSTNGVNWEPHLLPTGNSVTGLSSIGDRVVVGGSNGILLISDPVSGPEKTIREIEPLGNNHIGLDLLSAPGSTFQIERTSDLQEPWSSPVLQYAPVGRALVEEDALDPTGFFRAPISP